MEGLALGVQSINTCGSENEGLQKVRQRDDPSHHIITVNQHQPMHLTGNTTRSVIVLQMVVTDKLNQVYSRQK